MGRTDGAPCRVGGFPARAFNSRLKSYGAGRDARFERAGGRPAHPTFQRLNQMNVQEYYQHALTERGFTSDPAQAAAVARLQQAYDDWGHSKAQRSSTFKRRINRPDVPKGVYIWGGVGRGK